MNYSIFLSNQRMMATTSFSSAIQIEAYLSRETNNELLTDVIIFLTHIL